MFFDGVSNRISISEQGVEVLPSCFVTGTDTDAGKTVVTASILRMWSHQGYRCAGMKPVASGFHMMDGEYVNADIEAIVEASPDKLPMETINQYSFVPPIAPHIAARESGCVIDSNLIVRRYSEFEGKVDRAVVEGAGGWRVPLNWPKTDSSKCETIASLAKKLNLPVVLVVGMKLGCINHALLSAEAVLADGVQLLGWVANAVEQNFARAEENLETLHRLMPAPLLFQVPYLSSESDMRTFVPQILAI